MDTEKKTGERIGITLALLACVGFSAFLIWLQQSQENDRQQLTQQVQDSSGKNRRKEAGRSRSGVVLPGAKQGISRYFPCREGFIRRILR